MIKHLSDLFSRLVQRSINGKSDDFHQRLYDIVGFELCNGEIRQGLMTRDGNSRFIWRQG